MWLILGEKASGSIWGVGQLGSVDKVIHRGAVTSSSASWSSSSSPSSRSSSHSSDGGVCMREVKVPLAVVVIAWEDEGIKTCQGARCGLNSLGL